jgi:bacterioferritin-associated ferredoxin
MPAPSAPATGALSDPPRLVCRCLGISSRRIVEVARAGSLSELGEIQAATKAGTGCGTCHPEIREILCDLAGEIFPAAERLHNRQVCQSETEARIERALLGWVGPGSARESSLEVTWVRDLRVGLRLVPDDPATRVEIAERLRKSVCEELQIYFSS